MILTEKCKDDFNQWFKNEHIKSESESSAKLRAQFSHLPTNYQFGIYGEFFKSNGIRIKIETLMGMGDKFLSTQGYRYYLMYNGESLPKSEILKDRDTIKQNGVSAANTLYNNELT